MVVLITNAPRTAQAVEEQLGRIGLPGDAWDAIATSGEAGIAALDLFLKDLTIAPIDYNGISYYSAPKQKKQLNSLDEVDPELLRAAITAANKAQAIYANYLENSEKTKLALLLEVAERAEKRAHEEPKEANAWYCMAYALGRYSQGISIAKALVEAHGGTISATSAGLGHGTTFTVRLPTSA